ncbi:Putative B3 domain-containing protein Os08g0325100 [Linum perenne]
MEIHHHQHQHHPSFLRVFIRDFADKLVIPIISASKTSPHTLFSTNLCFLLFQRIPDGFMDKYGDILPRKLVLKSSYGNLTVVSVERSTRGCYFKLGWGSFVEENAIEEGDFMVFNFSGNETVDVVVYESDGCLKGLKDRADYCIEEGFDDAEEEIERKEKKVKPRAPKLKRRAPKTKRNPSSSSSGKARGLANLPSFHVDFKKHMKHSLYLPAEFCRTAKLSVGNRALLKDPNGKIWSVGVISADRTGRNLRLGSGWPEFATANGVRIGDRLELCFEDGIGLIEVKIDREKVSDGVDWEEIDRKEVKIENDGFDWERIIVID